MEANAAVTAERARTTVVIVDDHAVVRSGLKMLLQAEEQAND
jgi:FixJ family two-component response regulator